MKLLPHTHTSTSQRNGKVVIGFAVSLTSILAFVALALDGGILLDKRRQAQCVADSAALAAANELYANWWIVSAAYGPQYQGLDPDGTAKAAALATAKANGYEDGVGGCTVVVNIPPLSGPFKGMPTHTEVIISAPQQQFFSRMFGSDTVVYGARAVSRGRRGGINDAIICLDPTGKGALNAGGNGLLTVSGAPIQVNSTDPAAMIANGGGSMSAPTYLVGGSPGASTPGGGSFTGTLVPNSPPIPDPLASLPVPDPNTMTIQSNKKISNAGNKTLNLQPGVYVGGIDATGGTVIMAPGIYYMQGGGFNISGQANLTATGVLIYNAPQSNSDQINITGNGTIVMSPMTTGPYQGILLFQDRTSTTPVSVSGSSGTTMTISGTFYAASATLSVQGNGNQQTIGSQYISYDLVLGGNGTYFCSWSPDITPGTREVMLVE
jgi:hypothetical protein